MSCLDLSCKVEECTWKLCTALKQSLLFKMYRIKSPIEFGWGCGSPFLSPNHGEQDWIMQISIEPIDFISLVESI